jgi:flagellar biosynthesis protein FlhF
MKLKSYFANSIQDAIEKARVELGPDAMLIHSSETSSELRDLGSYEVVFGVSPSVVTPEASGAPQRLSAAAAPIMAGNLVLQELAELRKQVALVTQSVERAHVSRDAELWRPELTNIFNRLLAAGFSREFAHGLTEAVALRVQAQAERPHRVIRDHRDLFGRDLLNAVLVDEIGSRFEVDSLLPKQDQAAAVLFIGPPGAGKTASVMKLGLRYGLRERRPLQLLSLDSLRIGGCDHLNAFARISGAGFQMLQHHSMLEHAVTRAVSNGLTLIDTPGLGRADESYAEDLAEASRHLDLDVHLVLPAYTTPASAEQMSRRFARFKPSKLLLTHMDELERPAVAIEIAARFDLPLSFLGTGQQVPEDIQEANKRSLLDELMPLEIAASTAA